MSNNKHISNTRNLSIIAMVDAGKTTLCDTLLSCGKIIADKDAGTKRAMSAREDEQKRGITIKSSGATIYINHEDKQYKINVVDSPGHASFNREVTCALRITDGCIVVIDCVEGIQVQTETVLRQAIQEKIKPVLVINKIDRLFLELNESPNDMYFRFEKQIHGINNLIKTYSDNDESLLLDPLKGNVVFASAYFGWGFSLKDFAKYYANRNGGEPAKYIKMLWNTIDKKTGNSAFCQMIMDPIYKIFRSIMDNNMDEFNRMTKKLNLVLTNEERNTPPKKLFGNTMKKLFPLSNTLLELIIKHLPSPIEAQEKRVDILYNGPLDDKYASSIKNCDPEGPLVIYISKMIPDNQGKFIGFGRVFSGTLKPGMKVNIMDDNYDQEAKTGELFLNKSVQRCCNVMAGKFETVDSIECGNTCGIVGVDQYLVKTGTIVNAESLDAFNIKTMKFTVSPVVKVAIKPKNPVDVPSFIIALKKLVKSDPSVLYNYDEETKETTISATGELHMEICLHDLREYLNNVDLIVSDPIVSFRETVDFESDGTNTMEPCLGKSSNKHNRIYLTSEKLSNELIEDIESGKFQPNTLPFKERNQILVSKYRWNADDAKRLWKFGPEGVWTNALLDKTKGAQYINEIKGSIITAFNTYTFKGPICNEQVRGVRFNIHDVLVHADSAHRGGDQIIPMVRRAMYSSMLMANPVLFEPIFLADIQIPDLLVGTVFNCMNQRRGVVIDQEKKGNLPLTLVKAWIPVAESFGLNEFLCEATSGQAFLSLTFDCWQRVPGNIYQDGTKSNEFVIATRLRKNLGNNVPTHTEYLDKL
jgi:elongation factor 2